MNFNEILAIVEIGFNKLANLMEILQNLPNIIFIVIGFILIGTWLFLQATFPKESEASK